MFRLDRSGRTMACVAALVLVAAACGNDDGTSPPVTQAPVTQAPTTSPGQSVETTAPEPEGCDEGDPFIVGGMFSLSGPAADIGALAKHGVEMVQEDINEAGGVLGRCLEIQLRDDESDPTKGSVRVRELVDREGIEFMVGPFLSSICAAALEVTAPVDLLHVVACVLPAAGDASVYPYVFRSEVVASLQGETFVDYITKSGWQKIGIIAVNNALGTSNADAVAANLKDGQQIVAQEFHESGVVDLSAQMRKLQQAGSEVVLMLNTAAPDQIAGINARNSLKWDVPILGFSSLGNASTRDALGAENMTSVYGGQAYRLLSRAPSQTEPVGEKAQTFRARYKEFLGQDPLSVNLQQAAGIYDSYMMMVTAINAVGSTEPAAVRAWLESNVYEGIKARYVFNAERHDGPTLEDFVFVEASSLADGMLTLAPNQ